MVKKILERKKGKILGENMVGEEVNEIIKGLVIEMKIEKKEEEMMN